MEFTPQTPAVFREVKKGVELLKEGASLSTDLFSEVAAFLAIRIFNKYVGLPDYNFDSALTNCLDKWFKVEKQELCLEDFLCGYDLDEEEN